MFRKLGLLCAALACFSLAGGHWAALQGVAWARMLTEYSQSSGSLVTGFEQTFDGGHACELCRAIAAGKSQEQKGSDAAAGAKETAKVKAIPAETGTGRVENLPVEAEFGELPPGNLVVRAEPPPTPPPRRTARVA